MDSDTDTKSVDSYAEEDASSEEADPTEGMDYATKDTFRSAISYLEYSSFSRQGLISCLRRMGVSLQLPRQPMQQTNWGRGKGKKAMAQKGGIVCI